MDNKKIDEIGKKLDVNSSEINPKKSTNWFKKHSFWMIHSVSFVLSSLMGLFFGLHILDNWEEAVFYPYYIDRIKRNTIGGVVSINILNGIITIIPKTRDNKLNRIVRSGIVILNFIFSLTITLIIFLNILLLQALPKNHLLTPTL